jgi:hypothetical protein
LVKSGPSIAATVSCDSATKRAILDSNVDLKRKTTYVATVTTGSRDLAGNPLANNVTWSFKVQ